MRDACEGERGCEPVGPRTDIYFKRLSSPSLRFIPRDRQVQQKLSIRENGLFSANKYRYIRIICQSSAMKARCGRRTYGTHQLNKLSFYVVGTE